MLYTHLKFIFIHIFMYIYHIHIYSENMYFECSENMLLLYSTARFSNRSDAIYCRQ